MADRMVADPTCIATVAQALRNSGPCNADQKVDILRASLFEPFALLPDKTRGAPRGPARGGCR